MVYLTDSVSDTEHPGLIYCTYRILCRTHQRFDFWDGFVEWVQLWVGGEDLARAGDGARLAQGHRT